MNPPSDLPEAEVPLYWMEFALFFPPHFPEKCSNISFKLFIGLTLAKYFFFLLKSRLGLSILGGKVTIFV